MTIFYDQFTSIFVYVTLRLLYNEIGYENLTTSIFRRNFYNDVMTIDTLR